MGLSLPPPATLDLVGSYARRTGDSVELVLARSDLPSSIGGLVVRLTRGAHSVTGTAQVRASGEGSDVLAQVPAGQLSDGIWQIGLGGEGDDEFAPVTARLLVQGPRPVVLLWGAKATASRVPASRPAPGVPRRAATTGGKVLDAGLRVLPEPSANKVRQKLRRMARSLIH
jgi:hypothetical protein